MKARAHGERIIFSLTFALVLFFVMLLNLGDKGQALIASLQ